MFADENMMESETLDRKLKARRLMQAAAYVHALAGEDARDLAFGEDALYNADNYDDDWGDEIYND